MKKDGWKRALRDSEKRELEQAERLRDLVREGSPDAEKAARDNYNAVYRRLLNRCVARLRRADTDKEQGE
jgi:hypothetical protein